jgi:hypothetical protein
LVALAYPVPVGFRLAVVPGQVPWEVRRIPLAEVRRGQSDGSVFLVPAKPLVELAALDQGVPADVASLDQDAAAPESGAKLLAAIESEARSHREDVADLDPAHQEDAATRDRELREV